MLAYRYILYVGNGPLVDQNPENRTQCCSAQPEETAPAVDQTAVVIPPEPDVSIADDIPDTIDVVREMAVWRKKLPAEAPTLPGHLDALAGRARHYFEAVSSANTQIAKTRPPSPALLAAHIATQFRLTLAILEHNSINARMIERRITAQLSELLDSTPAVALLGPRLRVGPESFSV